MDNANNSVLMILLRYNLGPFVAIAIILCFIAIWWLNRDDTDDYDVY